MQILRILMVLIALVTTALVVAVVVERHIRIKHGLHTEEQVEAALRQYREVHR